MNETTERRDARCGVVCLLCYDGNVDHCAYCKVEEGVGPHGQELPPLPSAGHDGLGYKQIGVSYTFVVKEGYDSKEQELLIRERYSDADIDTYEHGGKHYITVSFDTK